MADANSSDSNGYVGSSPVPSNVAEIIIVRHGETTWNASAKIQGHLDVELNDVGRQQAAAVALRLCKDYKISAVYSSDLKRALETAETIAKHCGLSEVIHDSGLRERHLGDLQGVIFHEAAKVNPAAYRKFVSHDRNQEIPGGGESLNQLYNRCTSSIDKIAKEHKGERVVVVSHGGAMRALFKRANSKGLYQGKVMNASVNIFDISENGEWKIKVWGDVSHLSDTGFLASAFGGDKNSG